MAELLKRWLHEELGVSFRVVAFEPQFSNGYYLGEVLHKCNLQPDFDMFENSDNPDAMVNNFTRLQPVLTRLGINVDARLANAIMTEDRGVAAKLIYQIKARVDSMRNTLADSRRAGSLAKTLTIESAPSRALVEVQAGKAARARYDQSRYASFEDQLRLTAANPNALLESLHLQRFASSMAAQMDGARRLSEQAKTAELLALRSFRAALMALMEERREAKHRAEVRQRKAHHKVVMTRRNNEKLDLRVEMTMYELRERHKGDARAATVGDVQQGIEQFESNLTRLGTESLGAPREGPSEGQPPSLARPLDETPLDTIRAIRGKVADAGTVARQSEAYLAAIRMRRKDELQARREREARRMKVLVDQQRALDEAQYEASLQALRGALARRGEGEQALGARLSQVEAEEDVMREDRLLREAQYADRSERDATEALHRETIALIAARGRYGEAAAAQMARLREEGARRAAEERREVEALCREAALAIAGVAERCAEYRASLDAPVPRAEYRAWVAALVRRPEDVMPRSLPGDLAAPLEACPAAQEGLLQVLRTAAVRDYLEARGDWEGLPHEPAPPAICRVVADVFRAAEMAAPPPAPLAPPCPIRLALVGAPFAGKTTLAARIARHFRLKVIDPQRLVEDAVRAAEGAGEAGAGEDELTAMGREALAALRGGGVVGDELLCRLAAWAIRGLADQLSPEPLDLEALAQPPTDLPAPDAPAKGAKTPAPKKKDARKERAPASGPAEEAPQFHGFVLDGFPATQAQSVLLEGMLTGLDLAKEARDAQRASALAPPPEGTLPDPERRLRSGLDAVALLSLEDAQVAVQRGQGRRVDPRTGAVYHLEANPPPTSDPGLLERLVEDAGDANDVPHLHQRLLAAGEVLAPLRAWLGRFQTLVHAVDGAATLEAAFERVQGVLLANLRAKEAAGRTGEALAACEGARAAAEEARAQAEAARKATEAAALDLFRAKLAEVQAAEMLQKKGVDVAATELLKAQAAEACATAFKGAVEAASQAQAAARAAAEALEAAEAAHARCEGSLEDAAALSGAHEAALANAQVAKASLDAARRAAETAGCMTAAAHQSLERAQRAAAGEEVEEMKELAAATAAAGAGAAGKGPKTAPKGGKEDKKAVAVAAVAEPSTADAGAPPFVPPPLDPAVARELWDAWSGLEAAYMQAVERILADLRQGREDVATHFIATRRDFVSFLHAPDAKRQLAETLWADIRQQGAALWTDAAANTDALASVAELRDRLWDLCDGKMKESEARKAQVASAPFVALQSERMIAQFIDLAQAELTRLFAVVAYVQRAPKVRHGIAVSASKPVPEAPSLKEGVAVAEFAAALKALPLPPWFEEVAKPLPKLAASAKLALAACDVAAQIRVEADPASLASRAPELAAVVAAQEEEAREACAREAAATKARLDAVFRRLLVQLREVRELSERTVQRLDEWLKRRYHGEVQAVSELAGALRQSLQGLGEQPLGELHYEGDTFDRETLSVGALGTLHARLATAAQGRFLIATPEAARVVREAFAEDRCLPAELASASAEAVEVATSHLEVGAAGVVDRRRLMASLLAAVFPRLAQTTPGVIKETRRTLEAADAAKTGFLSRDAFLGCALWFQKTTQEYLELQSQLAAPSSADAKGKGGAAKGSAAKGGAAKEPKGGKKGAPVGLVDLQALEQAAMEKYNASAALKELLFDCLSAPQGEGGELQVGIDAFLGLFGSFAEGDSAGRTDAEAVAAEATGEEGERETTANFIELLRAAMAASDREMGRRVTGASESDPLGSVPGSGVGSPAGPLGRSDSSTPSRPPTLQLAAVDEDD